MGFPPPAGRKSKSPFGRAINPWTLVPTKTDIVIVDSSSVAANNPRDLFNSLANATRGTQRSPWRCAPLILSSNQLLRLWQRLPSTGSISKSRQIVALRHHPSLHLFGRHFFLERCNGPHVPEGSAIRPAREPKNMSVIGMISFAPASTARLTNSSESSTKICASSPFAGRPSIRRCLGPNPPA